MSLIKTVSFKPLGDARGSLVTLEAHKTLPFDIKRVYYIFYTREGVSRGFYAHRHLKQLAVYVTGSCRFVLDNGKSREEVVLDSSTTGLLIEEMVWREMYDFSPDCVLMVLVSEYYDENDYIRDYQGMFNVTLETPEDLQQQILSLPISPTMTHVQLDKVINVINVINQFDQIHNK